MAATLIILVAAILAFVSGRVPLAVVAIGVALALWATGVLDLQQALAGFGDPTVLFIASLFVVSEALEATGVTAWAGSQVIRRAGTTRTAVLLAVCLLVAVLTAFISVNGAVAALIPMAVVVATRAGIPVSHLLLPLAFTAHAGSMLLLTGTPVNIIVSEAAQDAGERSFGFFEFGLVGVPLLTGTVVVIVFLGRFLLPDRAPSELPSDLTAVTGALRDQYALPAHQRLTSAEQGVTEVIVAPRSRLVGLHVFPGMATPSGDLVVVAVQRGAEEAIVIELSQAALTTAGIAVLAAITVTSGGYFMTRVVAGDVPATPFQTSFFRAGHAHAGVLIILGLVSLILTEATALTGGWASLARSGALVAAILMPAGFFFSAMGRGRERPSRAVALLYLGAAFLIAGLATLGVGLLSA